VGTPAPELVRIWPLAPTAVRAIAEDDEYATAPLAAVRDALVPPLFRAMFVADQVPVPTVPRVVILELPAHVLRAVFSTLPSPSPEAVMVCGTITHDVPFHRQVVEPDVSV